MSVSSSSKAAAKAAVAAPPPTLFQRYLSTIYEDRDFAAHHRLHSEHAYLLAGPRVDLRRDLPQADYAAYMQMTLAQLRWDGAALRRREPCFGDARLRSLHPAGAGETLALVALREAQTGRALWAAFGVAPERGRWALRWVTLLPPAAAPPPDDDAAAGEALARALRAQAAAELAAVPPLTDERTLLLTMLEVSYFRQHLSPAEALSFLPEARFSCHGSQRCCESHFSARLTENDRAALDALAGQADLRAAASPLYQRLPVLKTPEDEARPYTLGHDERGRCLLLTAVGRCRLHEEAGFAVFHDCHIFPYGFTRTPDGVAVWTNLFCPSVRAGRGAPLAENEADIRGRLQRLPRRGPQRFLRAHDQEIPWAHFRAAEEGLLRYLAGDGAGGAGPAPLRGRLLAGLRWLSGWAPGAPPPPYDAALLALPLAPAAPEDVALAAPLLALFTRVDYFQPVPPPAAGAGHPDVGAGHPDVGVGHPDVGVGHPDVGSPRPDSGSADPDFGASHQSPAAAAALDAALEETPFLPYLLRTLVFSKYLSYPHGVVPGFNFVALAYCLLARRFAGWPGAAIRPADWEHACNGLQHAFYRRQVAHLLNRDAATRSRSASPDLGERLLRATLLPPGA